MKKGFLISLLLVFQISNKAADRDSIVVTYIANCGFLIEMDSTRIIIDGLFTKGFDVYATPDSVTLNSIISGLKPFDNIDYVFITHKHADHFDSQAVIEFMLNNHHSKLICPNQVIQELQKHPKKYKHFESRVIDCTPDTFTSKTITLDKIKIIGYRLAHMNDKNRDIENIAYFISTNHKSIFHTGDADPNLTYKYSDLSPSDNKIDIAFINGAFGNCKNFQITNKFVGANKNIAMHFPKDFFKMEHKKITDVPDYFIEPIIFKESMERKVFYTPE